MEKYGKYFKEVDAPLLNRKCFGAANYLEQIYSDVLAHPKKAQRTLRSNIDPLFRPRDEASEIEKILELQKKLKDDYNI